ncbi:acyltransferase family protein [Vibrio parahaemolyticus]|uniref:acyltransferase family protein n=1 Tax=Vibrio parahaemolyticus TaxID=670 RepID=UPI00249360E9|nr:acyltransferase family protein [Vibrio parahaemolyticus]
MSFRYDINGLRAIAVIAVVLFHFNPAWVPGGFAGVDVFFVISGFLMTGIIFRGIDKKEFSFLKFYIARFRRIVPAMVMMMIVVMIFGFVFFNPIDYREMSIYSIVSAIFVSNVYFFKHTDYFNPEITKNIFVHTWSLSAEWQFYIIYPVVLCFISYLFHKSRVRNLIFFFTILGFFYCLYESVVNPNSSYYLLSSRAWEMLLGGCAYFVPMQIKHDSFFKKLSLFGVLISFFIVSKNDYWPGYMSLLPVLSSFFFISISKEISWFRFKGVEYLGSRSYSLYLWHWPIVVLITKYYELSVSYIVFGVTISLLMSEISYRLFEKDKKIIRSLLAWVLLLTISGIGYQSNGFNLKTILQPEASEYLEFYSKYKEKFNLDYGVIEKLEINEEYNSVFLWGDSHAESLSYGLGKYLSEREIPFRYMSSGNCMASVGLGINDKKKGTDDYNSCIDTNKLALEYVINNKPKLVIFAQKDLHDKNNLKDIIDKVDDSNITYLLIGPVPQWKGGAPLKVAYEGLNAESNYLGGVVSHLFDVDRRAKDIYGKHFLNYISILDEICLDDKSCVIMVGDKKRALHWDNNHLSLDGSSYLANEFLGEKVVEYFNLP